MSLLLPHNHRGRLVKIGLLDSPRIGAVGPFAELLFVRLILSACPLGRFYADPTKIRLAAFPNRPRTRSSDIASALDELEDAGLVRRYTASPEAETLLVIERFAQAFKYRTRSPFPAPPGEDPPNTYIEEKREDARAQDGLSRESDRTLPAALDTPQFREAWGRWLVHWSESFARSRVMPTATADAHLVSLAKFSTNDAITAINNAITRGLREPALPFSSNKPNHAPQPSNPRSFAQRNDYSAVV